MALIDPQELVGTTFQMPDKEDMVVPDDEVAFAGDHQGVPWRTCRVQRKIPLPHFICFVSHDLKFVGLIDEVFDVACLVEFLIAFFQVGITFINHIIRSKKEEIVGNEESFKP